MPFQKISGNFVELSVDNYLGSIKSGSSISDLGFRTYRESVAGVMPVSGTGGNPGISLALNTTNPLSSDADLRLVKDSVNRQGEGFSVDFSIQNRHQSKVLQISFDMELISGTYTNPDLIPKSGTFTVASTTCTVTASHSLVVGQAVNMSFPGGTAPTSGLYVITAIVPGVSFSFTVTSGSGSGVSCTWNIISSLRVYIIANPTINPTVIEPVNTGLQLGIANQKVKHIASFQTNNSGNSYRMVIHITKPGILPYTIDFANFKVWEPTQSVGAVITDWQSYTPTIQGGGTLTNVNTLWRRVGGSLEIQGRVTTGTVSSSEFQLSLPSGLSINSNLTQNPQYVGNITRSDTSANSSKNFTLLATPNHSYLRAGIINTASTNNTLNPLNTNLLFGNNEAISFKAEVPIAGWGSNVAMSSDTGDGRAIEVILTGVTSQSITTSSGIVFNVKVRDTHNAINLSSGSGTTFTAPVSGLYNITGGGIALNQNSWLVARVNSTNLYAIGIAISNATGLSISGDVYLNSGDVLRIVGDGSITAAGATYGVLSIKRISAGSQVIASSEAVYLRYRCTNGQTISSSANTDIQYNDRVYDSHGAYSNSNYRFTAPMSGTYLITASILPSSNTALGFNILAFVNTTSLTGADAITIANVYNSTNGMGGTVGSLTLRLNAGDYVRFTGFASSNNINLSQASPNNYSTLTITRLGV